jgi:hypothetical protein
VKVTGTVTLDQKPLDDGDIIFRTPGDVPTLIPIKNGSFAGEAVPGKKIVEIRAYKPQPPPPPMPGVTFEPGKINYLPPQYNEASKLEAEVPPGGKDDFKFELKSGG